MIKLNYEVTNIPLWFKPFYYLSPHLGALLITFYRWGVLHSCSIHFEGQEFVEPYPSRIESIWHYKGPMYWLALKNVDHYVQFSHPLWYMYKIILALRWQGVKVILGSAGHSGREAAKKYLVENGCKVVKWNGKGKDCYMRDPYGLVFNLWENKKE